MADNWDDAAVNFFDSIQRSMLEIGGKKMAKRLIVSFLEQSNRATPSLLATMVGLPVEIVNKLLEELGHENCVYRQKWHNLELWRVL